MFMLLALVASASPSEADQRLSRMTTLYDSVCLKAFPDDEAVVALMKARNAREMTPEEVKVTMRADPARGWDIRDGGATVWLELPPFHACSVRWNAPAIGDLSAYRTIAKAYQSRTGGFTPLAPMDGDLGGIHVHGTGDQRTLPDNGTETLFVIDQHITDPLKRAAGQTGVSLRFVHQFAPPRTGQ